MSPRRPNVWIGTSGYSYADWVGPFYPRGTRPPRMLAEYSKSFPMVELNFTFYQLPTAERLAKLAAQTPSEFRFLVKLPRSLSHERNLRDLSTFCRAVEPLQADDRLLGVLCQLAESQHFGPAPRQWLETLGTELA